MPVSTGLEFTKIFSWDGVGTASPHYTDVTLEAQSPRGTSFTILNTVTHSLYLGHDEKFDMAVFDVEVGVGLGELTWEYYSTAWTQFIPGSGRLTHDPDFNDMGQPYAFGVDGVELFPMNLLSDWEKVTINSSNKYWVRVTAASVNTGPSIKRIQMRPLNAYCTTQDVFELLQLANVTSTSDFTTSTIPSKKSVEQYIEAAQSKIDFRTRKSWRPNYISEEYHDFNINGIKLRRNDAYKVIAMHIWDGADFEKKTQGRIGDYFLTPDVGFIYFSRYFLLPARFQSYNAPIWRWGGGEFTQPIKISYLAGRDINTDSRQGGMIQDICKKMAAIDVMRSADFGNIAVSGMDRVSGSEKISAWQEEIEDRLDFLTAFEVF